MLVLTFYNFSSCSLLFTHLESNKVLMKSQNDFCKMRAYTIRRVGGMAIAPIVIKCRGHNKLILEAKNRSSSLSKGQSKVRNNMQQVLELCDGHVTISIVYFWLVVKNTHALIFGEKGDLQSCPTLQEMSGI